MIYAKPVVIHAAPAGVVYQPMYLHIPPGHEKHWSKHCAKYNACGRPVYFVRDKRYRLFMCPSIRRVMGRGTTTNITGKREEKRTKTIMGTARAMIKAAAAQLEHAIPII